MEILKGKKKLIILVLVILAVLAAMIVASGFALPDNPEEYIHISRGGRHVGDHNIDIMGMSFDKEGSFSPKVEDMISQMWSWNDAAISEITEKFESPMNIKLDYKTGDGKTTITYSGTATRKDNKELVNYKNEKVFDFILVREEYFDRDSVDMPLEESFPGISFDFYYEEPAE